MSRHWNQYILFGGEYYYAKGGMNDWKLAGTSPIQLQVEAEKMEASGDLDWWHIMDVVNWTVVARSKHQAHGVRGGDFVPGDCRYY